MAIELKVPNVGESITEVMIGEWLKNEGDWADQDEVVVIIETDKVNVDLPAPEAGVITKIIKGNGEEAVVGDVIGLMEAKEKPAGKEKAAGDAAGGDEAGEPPAAEDAAGEATGEKAAGQPAADKPPRDEAPKVMPAARRLLAQAGLDASEVEATGPGGRLLKEDVERHLEARGKAQATAEVRPKPPAEAPPRPAPPSGERREEVVPMSPLRRRVAERLVAAQTNAALLTTFNEIDMSAVIDLRRRYKERFIEQHGVKLGFMSFFVKAVIEALKAIPQLNAEIRGDDVVYRNYYDVGVAVGGGKGLVVPVIRNAERLSFAEIEKTIGDLAKRARDGKLTLDELQGGTFTISNGGVYGSLLSTPIVNPPQSGILGMHKIEERPVAAGGQVVVRPMMYVALTYDHRLVDGREAVTFLVRVKETIEDPSRILLEV
ncbi:MAG: 2-oxoglutarate dehydrogenase complex dihydrolipoyllysine-residue succinyltransferase [Acidobacteria bacterium]|nr:MAG: 2-oxoglutarate dehydrogenase complex dihydrolipoyllysine-residue succinyltransferase [Acidobacteriota bacterium]